jgi:uncharacterized membrane protein YgcG
MKTAGSRALLTVVAAASLSVPVTADEGWVIDRLDIQFDIQRDGTIRAREAFDVDFKDLSRHGIFRDISYRFTYDENRDREYAIKLTEVMSDDGRPQPVETTTEGALRRFRIGDPDRTVSGKQTYRITYVLDGALNGFPDHDELYWNASGTWPVTIQEARVIVRVPEAAIERVDCFQGLAGSTERCDARQSPESALFMATRPLAEREQLTIVVGLRKGAVAEPRPILVARPRDVLRFFDRTPALVGWTLAGLAVVVVCVGTLWWRIGRDRRFVSLYYLAQDPRDERVPLFASDPIAVEFEPPAGLRPAQMGLLLDERADTLDVTATIVDLAVRGYLRITELPKTWFLGKADWQLDRLKPPDAALLEYERIVLRGLFDAGASRKLSGLKNTFHDDLSSARKALYADAVARGWFPRNPTTVRTVSVALGILAAAAGVFAVIVLGRMWGAGLLGLPVVVGGLVMAVMARAMPRRTAAGREAMRRTLGFIKYIKTAEVRQQAFAERANIFTAYLPYAVVFKCVDKWARAFRDLDVQRAISPWYSGGSRFDHSGFSSSLGSFSSSVSTAISSTPGGSGGSGFSGGSSGGGGGGGGGGSW